MFFNDLYALLVYFICAIVVSYIAFLISYIFGIRAIDSNKLSAYECGFTPFEDARNTFEIHFYLVAILFLMFDLDDYFLLSHLRMEGKYFFKKSSDSIDKHEHVIFELDDNTELRYRDTRKFGKMYLIKKEDIDKIGPLVELGLEPWDNKLTSKYLLDKFKNKRLPIKTVLLDQSIIVGIGNIYADEILFLCKINPLKKCRYTTFINNMILSNVVMS